MKRRSAQGVFYEAGRWFTAWLGWYGLSDALRINQALGRLLREEKLRRKGVDMK